MPRATKGHRDAGEAKRRAAIRAAYVEVTTGVRIRLSPTVTVPAVLVEACPSEPAIRGIWPPMCPPQVEDQQPELVAPHRM